VRGLRASKRGTKEKGLTKHFSGGENDGGIRAMLEGEGRTEALKLPTKTIGCGA